MKMTTSRKITLAFTLATLLMASLAFVSYQGLTDADRGYRTSSRLSSIDIASSNILIHMNSAAYSATMFVLTKDLVDMERAFASLDLAVASLADIEEMSKLQATKDSVELLFKELQLYDKTLIDLQKYRLESLAAFENSVLPSLKELELALEDIARRGANIQNVAILTELSKVWPILSAIKTNLNIYIETREIADRDTVAAALVNLEEILVPLELRFIDPEGEVVFGKVTKALHDVSDTFDTINPIIANSYESTIDAIMILDSIKKYASELSQTVANLNASTDASFIQGSTSTIRKTLTVAIVGLILSVMCATFIIVSINTTFKKLSIFFGHIAEGNFQAKSGITEKGTIGSMVTKMQEIPRILIAITEDTNNLSQNIMRGAFRERFNTSKYEGGFAALGNSINSLADSYTTVLDLIPNSIMACTKEKDILFLNTPAQELLSGNHINLKCNDIFGLEVCSSDACFGGGACHRNDVSSGEVSLLLGEKLWEISVMATPLIDGMGEPIGFMEILTDITALKEQQNLILSTTAEASEIADRVATASVELAAQVEEIQRGVQEQMRQVESTASAMSEMNSTVLEVARNASQASSQTNETREKADNGSLLVNKVVESINQVNTIAQTLQINMQELGEQAESIGSVMNVISDIADQTNLLALNAAIEAARAGDAGRGFAVVADEVRKLAEKTMAATLEVGTSISTIQNSTRINLEEMTKTVYNVSEATELANASGQALNEIVELTESNSTVVASIATAAEEQSATSEEINHSLSEINQIGTGITANMEQSSIAVHELLEISQDLRSTLKKLD